MKPHALNTPMTGQGASDERPPPLVRGLRINEKVMGGYFKNSYPIITYYITITGTASGERGCTFKAFLDCKPINFSGTEGSIGLVKWFEKTEAVIRISGCTPRQSVMYATNLFLDQALTWWNGQVQSLGDDVAYSLSWAELKELMIAEYRPTSEVQKLETEFWNLTMVGADVTGYT